MLRIKLSLLPALNLILLGSTGSAAPNVEIPPAPREFRGVWVATVENIDWPSKPGLSVASQKAELIRILDKTRAMNMNAVVLQVRPAADAFYQSSLEPWSTYLTGRQGLAPMPFYDPLQFAVEESHRRGLELHAWFNPYRVSLPSAQGALAPTNIATKRPDLVKNLGKYRWLDPGEKEVQDHTFNVILDVVRRYDVDGVHFDDYFYPYKSYMTAVSDFPDEPSWQKYKASGGELSRADWRRQNVDILMQRVYTGIKQTKPHVKFGIAPFGIWRPGYPSGVVGMDAYNALYTDSRKWLREGWVDYFAPQLYWKVTAPKQSYPALVNWWVQQNEKGRHVWPGLIPARVGAGKSPWAASEFVDQILATRKQPGATGNIHFSMKPLMRNQGHVTDLMMQKAYTGKALIPASPWLDNTPPAAPVVTAGAAQEPGQVTIRWQPGAGEPPAVYAVYARVPSGWSFDVLPAGQTSLNFAAAGAGAPQLVAISAVDRNGNESQRALAPVGAAAQR